MKGPEAHSRDGLLRAEFPRNDVPIGEVLETSNNLVCPNELGSSCESVDGER